MSDRDADQPAANADDEEIIRLVDAAMQAHLEGGEAGLERFCGSLTRHREVVQKRLSALRRVGLLGDAPPARSRSPSASASSN